MLMATKQYDVHAEAANLHVLCCHSGEHSGRRVQPKSLVDDCSRIGKVLQVIIAWTASKLVHFLEQSLLGVGVSGQQVDAEGQGVGRGFIAGQDHGVGLRCYLPAGHNNKACCCC